MTATQAPTPGPLSATAAFVEAFGQSLDRDFAFWSSGTASSVRQVLYPLWKPASEEIRLAPTAPVEASGSERERLIEVVLSFPETVDLPTQRAEDLANEILAALRPQPSGETRSDFTPVVGLWKDQSLSRMERVRAHRFEFNSDVSTAVEAVDEEASRQALLSARPLALGGQQGEIEEALSCLADYDHTGRLEQAVRAALSTTPARAETHDEGAAGERSEALQKLLEEAEDFTDRMTGQPWACEIIERLVEVVTSTSAHPSPNPAADADRVRIAVEALEVKINAPLTGPTHGAWDRGRIAGLKEALAALKSTAATEKKTDV